MRSLLALALAAVVVTEARAATISGSPRADRLGASYNFERDKVVCGGGADLAVADQSDAVARDCETIVRRLSRDVTGDPSAQHETQVEPDSHAWGRTVITAFQSGRRSVGGAAAIGWSTTKNAGETWRSGFLAPAAESVSDPVVAYDAVRGQWLIALLGISRGRVDILLSRSRDGLAWSPPAPIVLAPSPDGDFDKQWLACDNGVRSRFRGRCYLSYLDIGQGQLMTQWSADGGATWSAQALTSTVLPFGTNPQGAFPVIRPDGALIVLFTAFAPFADAGRNWIAAARSLDGGATFAPSSRVSTLEDFDPLGVRAPPLVSADVDAAGRVYAAWSDCRFEDDCASAGIVLAVSQDGVTWTGPTPVPGAPAAAVKTDRFVPGLAVDPATRRLALAYYSLPQPDGCALDACPGLDVSLVESRDGGATWAAARQLNAAPMRLVWLPDTGLGRMVGDYISTSYAGGRPIAVVSIAVAPRGFDSLRQAIHALSYAPPARAKPKRQVVR